MDDSTVVLGLVDPLAGASGLHDAATDTWTFLLALLHWQVEGFPLADGPLELWEPRLTRDDLEERMHASVAGAVVRVPVLLGDELEGRPTASARLVGEPEAAEPSEEVAAARDAALRSVVVDHDGGTFTYRREWQAFRGRVDWAGRSVEVELWCTDAADAERALDRLVPWLADAAAHDARHRQVAADALLDALNDGWIDPAEPIVTEASFLARLAPRTLLVGFDGAEITVEYDDDGMFWGRTVVVAGTFADGPSSASI